MSEFAGACPACGFNPTLKADAEAAEGRRRLERHRIREMERGDRADRQLKAALWIGLGLAVVVAAVWKAMQ